MKSYTTKINKLDLLKEKLGARSSIKLISLLLFLRNINTCKQSKIQCIEGYAKKTTIVSSFEEKIMRLFIKHPTLAKSIFKFSPL